MKNMNRWLMVLVITGIISTTAQGAEEATPVMEGRDPGWYHGDQGANALKLGQGELPSALADIVKGYAQSWWTDKNAKIKSQVLRGHTNVVYSVAISPDNKFIVTGSYDRTARVWNAQTGALLNTLFGHTGEVYSVVISPDNSFIVTGSWDRTARIWDAQTGALLNTLAGHTGSVRSVAISSDNKFIVTGSYDNTARIWDAQTGAIRHTFRGHTYGVNSVAISPDNSFIVTGSSDGTARVWNRDGTPRLNADGQQIVLAGHTYGVDSVAISPDNRFVVTRSCDRTAPIWNAQTGELLNMLSGHTSWISSVAISPDSSFIVTGSVDHTARIWNRDGTPRLNADGQQIVLAGHTYGVDSVAISPDNRFIVTGSDDNTARIWNAQTGELLNTLAGHTDIVRSVAISPDSSFIVTGSWDRTARIWRLKRVDDETKELILNPIYTEITRKMNSRPLHMMVDYIHSGHQINLDLLAEINKLAPMEAGPEIDTQKIVTTIKSLLESGANPQSIQKDRDGVQRSIIDIASDLLNEDYPEIMTLLRENRSSIGGRIQSSGVVEKFQEMMGGRSSDKK